MRLDIYLDLALVVILEFLLSKNFARAVMSYCLCLKFLAFEIEQAKRIFLPRLGLNVQSKHKGFKVSACVILAIFPF